MTTIDEIRERWAAATPGPWNADNDFTGGRDVWGRSGSLVVAECIATDEDQAAIAAAPSDIATLLAALDTERARADRAEAERDALLESGLRFKAEVDALRGALINIASLVGNHDNATMHHAVARVVADLARTERERDDWFGAAKLADEDRDAAITRASGAELLYRDAAGQVGALRAEVERLRKVEEVAREVTSWDWLGLLVDHPDAETLAEDVRRLRAALESWR